MTILAVEIMVHLGSTVGWIAVGLITGWLANRVVKVARGGGYGASADLALGVIGALVGGVAFRIASGSEDLLWGSLAVAFVGACVLLAAVRILALGRSI